MFCKFCGNEIDDNSKFCASCGGSLADTDTGANTGANASTGSNSAVRQNVAPVNTVDVNAPVSRDAVAERAKLLKPIKISSIIMIFAAMFLAIAGFACAPIKQLIDSVSAHRDVTEYILSETELMLSAAVGAGFAGGVMALIFTLFAILSFFQSNKALDLGDAPYAVMNKKSTTIMVFIIITGVMLLSTFYCFAYAMSSLLAYQANEFVDTNGIDRAAMFAVLGFVTCLASAVPAIIALVKSIMFRVKVKKLV